MAKSRRNVSRRKRQQKRRKSNRRSFRKMSGGTDIREEDKAFLLNVEWKHPITDNNPDPVYSSIQDRLNKLANKSITWGSKETINSIISDSSAIYENGKQKFCIENIERLKKIADGNGGKINDKFYFTSVQIMKWLRPTVGPSTHAYSAPNSA